MAEESEGEPLCEQKLEGEQNGRTVENWKSQLKYRMKWPWVRSVMVEAWTEGS